MIRIFRSAKFLILSLGVALAVNAIEAKTYVDESQAASIYMAYPVPETGVPVLTPSPDGYVPFHIEHYGRHGSRWRIDPKDYTEALEILKDAHAKKILTPRGEEIYQEVKQIAADSKGRLGELTPLGHRQHQGIAERMMINFPELFTEETIIDAKSTEVIRCILSMANEVMEFKKKLPNVPITIDASQTTQDILNYNKHDKVVKELTDAAKPYTEAFRAKLPKPTQFLSKVFTDPEYIKKKYGTDKTFKMLFNLAMNMQSHDDYPSINDIFTEEELSNEWQARNAEWYIRMGNTPLTKNRNPYNQRVLLRSIIESADTAMLSPNVSANLRFGHDTMLTPLTVLMELGNYGYETTDLSTLADNWRDYEISPMGGNIQIIFYRPENKEYSLDDVLVKVLLNEREVSLPTNPVNGNYYKWQDVRNHYMDKLDNFSKRFKR